jgi:hypothetical protein
MRRLRGKGLRIAKETMRWLTPTALGGAAGGLKESGLCGAGTATDCVGTDCGIPTKVTCNTLATCPPPHGPC